MYPLSILSVSRSPKSINVHIWFLDNNTIDGHPSSLSLTSISPNGILTKEQGQYIEKLKPRHDLKHLCRFTTFHNILKFDLDLPKDEGLACNSLPSCAGSITTHPSLPRPQCQFPSYAPVQNSAKPTVAKVSVGKPLSAVCGFRWWQREALFVRQSIKENDRLLFFRSDEFDWIGLSKGHSRYEKVQRCGWKGRRTAGSCSMCQHPG